MKSRRNRERNSLQDNLACRQNFTSETCGDTPWYWVYYQNSERCNDKPRAAYELSTFWWFFWYLGMTQYSSVSDKKMCWWGSHWRSSSIARDCLHLIPHEPNPQATEHVKLSMSIPLSAIWNQHDASQLILSSHYINLQRCCSPKCWELWRLLLKSPPAQSIRFETPHHSMILMSTMHWRLSAIKVLKAQIMVLQDQLPSVSSSRTSPQIRISMQLAQHPGKTVNHTHVMQYVQSGSSPFPVLIQYQNPTSCIHRTVSKS